MHATLVASLAAAAAAAPLVSRQAAPPPMGVNDATILNYALSLEHLENAFYRDALKQYTAEDFKKAGLGADFYNNLEEIAKDEKTHVEYLTAGLTAAGAVPVQECTYNFGYTDIQSYLATANILEGVGVSAYLGAAKYLQSPDFLTAAGAILTVEARHSAYLRDNQEPPKSPFPAPFDIPLEFTEVYSLAAQFITGCPDQGATDGTLNLFPGFQPFPAITAAPAGIVKPGDKLTFTVAKEVEATNAYFITFPGGAIPAEISGSGATYEVVVPAEAQPGQAYVVLTKNGDKPTDDNIVAGPAVLDVFDNAAEFQASHPDYHYKDDDCKDDKPEYPKKPEYPSHPEQPEKPKAPEYPSKPEEPKKPEYPAHPEHPEKEHKPEYPKDKTPEYPEKEHKPEHPKKDEYPEKEHKDEHKPEHKDEYPEHKDEHKPEHKDEYPAHKDEHVKTPEHPKKPEEDCDEYGNPKKHY